MPLQSLLPSIGLTKRKLKTLETIQIVREERDQRKQDLAFNARPFVMCGLPLRRPEHSQLAYTRRNGRFSLTIVAHPEFGLPYGQDRLIPIWVATLALRQKSRVVRFRYLMEFLDYFDLPTTGFYYKRIACAFQRIFGATIFFGTEEHRDQHVFLDWARFHFFDQIRLWYSRDGNPKPAPEGEFQNTITLSDAFFAEIQKHGIPIERRVVAALSNAPGTLDFYTWLVWKCWATKNGTVRIPLFGCNGLAQQLGTAEYARDRSFREKINTWLKHVRLWWPACPARLAPDGRCLTISPQRQAHAISAVENPVNSCPRTS
ncbi:MAG: replication initiator protein A [Acidobacteriota bacterium]|nr:replication initiator protein A [Acidobacteriota bacterium]